MSTKAKGWMGMLFAGGTAAGVTFGSIWVKLACAAAFLVVLVIVITAAAYGVAGLRLVSMYLGKAAVRAWKGLAFLLVQLPLRGLHRLWTRYDLALRLRLVFVRGGYRLRDQAATAHATLAPVLPVAWRPRPTVETAAYPDDDVNKDRADRALSA